jgi:membrane fusion protein, multidrug efflux system
MVGGADLNRRPREGSVVQSGQVLFEIDPRPFQATLDQAEGQLAQARAQLDLAEINVNRDTPLAQAHAIAQSQLDNEVQQQAAQADSLTAGRSLTARTIKMSLSAITVFCLSSSVEREMCGPVLKTL